jgi:uncharacterized protein YceH (UPF0502 family)
VAVTKMETTLTFEEARVLGCLVEKEMATPEYYPMTVNSLLAACNQKSSRDPVVEFDSDTIEAALLGLREKRFSTLVHLAGARAAKHKHRLGEVFPELKPPHLAVLAVLLLRGPQTVGELRGRTERLYAFGDLEAVDEVLQGLTGHVPDPLVVVLPAGGGRHAKTFAHLLCGPVEARPAEGAAGTAAVAGRSAQGSGLAAEVEALRSQLDELRGQLDAVRGEIEQLRNSVSRGG